MLKIFTGLALMTSIALPLSAAEKVDLEVMNKIRHEGFYNSQVMEITEYLADEVGQRLSSSPQVMQANNYTADKFKEWGMKNVHLEGFEFGRGWTFEHVAVSMTAPRVVPVQAFPVAWFPGTDGPVEGPVIRANISSDADFDKYKGKLKGKIVLLSNKTKPLSRRRNIVYERHDDESIARSQIFRIPNKTKENTKTPQSIKKSFAKRLEKREFNHRVWQFFKDEGVLATVKTNSRLNPGLIDASSYDFRVGFTPAVPQVMMSGEGYNRMLRLMEKDIEVTLKIDVKATFHDEETKNYNVLADIPGKGRNPEIVLAGAHIDSWHLGDGAVDNAAGVAVVMEAMRILKAIGVKPKRTIRAALWGAEEQGLNGSRAYIQDHIADYPTLGLAKDETFKGELARRLRDDSKPLQLKKGHEKLSAYFNFDNGAGKIRGIHTHGNVVSAAIFNEWFKPFHDLGAETVSTKSSGSTDHAAFQNVGIPGYQFIQDPLDYFTRLHHKQLDAYDYVPVKDMKQSAVIMAAFLYNAAMREDRMPRRPMPVAFED